MLTSVDTPLQFIKEQESQTETPVIKNENKSKLEKLSFIVLFITAILSPIIFFKAGFANFDSIKSGIIVFGVLISSLLYAISLFGKKSISIPKNSIIVTSILICLSAMISAILSFSVQKSLIGQGFEMNTVSFLCILFLSMILVSKISSKSSEKILYLYSSIVGSFILLAVFHIVRLFIYPSFLSFGVLNTATNSLIGNWSDFGIFSALIFLTAFFLLNILNTKISFKILLYILLIVSGFFVMLVNMPIIWVAVSLTVLAYGIYGFVQGKSNSTSTSKIFSRISILTIIIFIITAIFAVKGTDLSKKIVNSFGLERTEVSLPWQLTLDVASDTIKNNPLFGAGPTRFINEYLLHKPLVINQTGFWNAEFVTGYSWLSTMVVTQGVIGMLLWILFFIFLFSSGVKLIRNSNKDSQTHFIVVSTFFSMAFLWFICLVYSPTYVVLFITFIITGLFISIASQESKTFGDKVIVINRDQSGKTFSLIVLIFVIVLSLWTLIYVKKFVANAHFRIGLSTLNSSDEKSVNDSYSSFKKALSWDKQDLYYQVLSEINLIKINLIAQQLQEEYTKNPKSTNPEKEKMISSLLSEAASSTLSAINTDPTNYYNYISNAKVNELAVSLFKIESSYQNAKVAYQNALTLNPYSPSLYLNLAKLEASQNKMDEAQKYIGGALQVKQDYIDAIFLLAQIQVSQNKINDAITSVLVTTQIDPGNPLLYFQLGLLYYNNKDYKNSVTSFEKAVSLNDQYANARYFLGLSYARLNMNNEAITQFEEIAKTNSDNEEVLFILSNLKAGKSPFTDATPPVDSKPEKRSTLPVKEKTTNSTKSKK